MLQTSRIVDLYSKMESLLYTMPLPEESLRSLMFVLRPNANQINQSKDFKSEIYHGSEIMAYNDPVE